MFIGAGVKVTVTDSSFTSNVGAVYGGGIAQFAGSTATLSGVAFTSNSASTYGGAYFMNSGATCVTSLMSCTFTSNTATTGGRGGGVSLVSTRNMKEQRNPVDLLNNLFAHVLSPGVCFGKRCGFYSGLQVFK